MSVLLAGERSVSDPPVTITIVCMSSFSLTVSTFIGRFAPPGPDRLPDGTSKYLDPMMRRSTEFPDWVDNNKHLLEGKKVLMCCTAGVRCERASAFMRNKGT